MNKNWQTSNWIYGSSIRFTFSGKSCFYILVFLDAIFTITTYMYVLWKKLNVYIFLAMHMFYLRKSRVWRKNATTDRQPIEWWGGTSMMMMMKDERRMTSVVEWRRAASRRKKWVVRQPSRHVATAALKRALHGACPRGRALDLDTPRHVAGRPMALKGASPRRFECTPPARALRPLGVNMFRS